MYGPCSKGHWSAHAGLRVAFQHLTPGHRYEVVRSFVDYDGDRHDPGETWTFLGANFLPYEDGQSLFVSMDGTQEWHIRLQWRPETQAEILDALGDFIRPLEA